MPVTTDGAGNYFIGSTISGVTRTELWNGNNTGLLNDIRTLSGIRSGVKITNLGDGSQDACYSFTSPLGVGGEVNTTAVTSDSDASLIADCQSNIGNNVRIAVMLWTRNIRRVGLINSGDTDSTEVTVPVSASIFPANFTYHIAFTANARFWMTVSQSRYITFFCYVDSANWYSIEMGYTHAVSGVVFPLNCIVKYNIKYQGTEYWYAGVPTSVGLTGVTAIPQTGKVNYTHLLSTYATKDATNLYAVTATNGIGRCGTNLKITRVPSLYSTLGVRSTFQTDSDVLGSPKRNYMVIGSSGTNNTELKLLMRFNGTGTVTPSNVSDEVRGNRVWIVTGSPTYSNSIFKFDGSSVRITNNIYSYTNPEDMLLGSSNFTIQFWVYPSSSVFSNQSLINYDQWTIEFSSTVLTFNDYSTGGNTRSFSYTQGAIISNQFNHIALSRSGTSLRCFINGTQVDSTKTVGNYNSVTLGYFMFNGSGWYIDSFSVHIGSNSGFYTANFTPPTIPYAVLPELIAMQTN